MRLCVCLYVITCAQYHIRLSVGSGNPNPVLILAWQALSPRSLLFSLLEPLNLISVDTGKFTVCSGIGGNPLRLLAEVTEPAVAFPWKADLSLHSPLMPTA